MQDKASTNKYDRQDIADVFAEFYEERHTSTTMTHEHEPEPEGNYEQHQQTKKPFTTQELSEATNQLKRGKAADTREVNAEMIKYPPEKTHTTTAQQGRQSPRAPTGGIRRSKSYARAWTHRHQPTTDPSVRSLFVKTL